MSLWSTIQKLFNSKQPPKTPTISPPPPEPEEDEIEVPEWSAEMLQERITQADAPHRLDIREIYEWNQVRMEDVQHIPMNEIPARLHELPSERQIVVFCAHGQRSYGVAHYLIENGYDAVSLAGGITDWAAKGFEVSVGNRTMI